MRTSCKICRCDHLLARSGVRVPLPVTMREGIYASKGQSHRKPRPVAFRPQQLHRGLLWHAAPLRRCVAVLGDGGCAAAHDGGGTTPRGRLIARPFSGGQSSPEQPAPCGGHKPGRWPGVALCTRPRSSATYAPAVLVGVHYTFTGRGVCRHRWARCTSPAALALGAAGTSSARRRTTFVGSQGSVSGSQHPHCHCRPRPTLPRSSPRSNSATGRATTGLHFRCGPCEQTRCGEESCEAAGLTS